MWLMLQHERPDGYVVATGESHTVEDFLDEALEYAGLDWEHHVGLDERYLGPEEVD